MYSNQCFDYGKIQLFMLIARVSNTLATTVLESSNQGKAVIIDSRFSYIIPACTDTFAYYLYNVMYSPVVYTSLA